MTGVIDRKAALKGHLHYNAAFEDDDQPASPTSEDGGYLDVAEHQLNDTNAASVVAKDLSNDDFTFHVGGTTAAQTDDADFEFTSGGDTSGGYLDIDKDNPLCSCCCNGDSSSNNGGGDGNGEKGCCPFKVMIIFVAIFFIVGISSALLLYFFVAK